MLKIGSVIDGKYKILNVIGKGGMSIVYLAMNERANKQWAIKEIRKDGSENYEIIKQGLVVEIDLLKQLNHAHLPSIVDVIDDGNTFLIVMDYIEGIPLSKLLAEEGVQSQENVIEWAKQLCSVLDYLHTRDNPIIYRDMKPSNVMLKPDGNVVLIDFGTARTFKETSVGDTTCLGTRGYAAPEQFGGRGQTDARTDIYCLGATIYHLVTGHNPCEPPYEMYPIRKWNSLLSSGLEIIVSKCTQPNPADRYQTCAELMYALEHYNELDESYKRKQNRKLGIFCATIFTTVVFGAASLAGYMLETSAKSNSYEYYIELAQAQVQKEAATLCYKKAININPARGEGYDRLLNDVILDDDVLTEEEAYQIRDILNESNGNNKTNESYFKENKDEYEAFSYKLGIAYFYSYEDSGNKALSKKWLEIAMNGESLKEQERERAKCLGKIAGYYSKIGVESKSGDTSIGYAEYWEDMISITSDNLVDKDNAITALVMYKELVYQIYTNCVIFKEEGITKNEMQKQLLNIKDKLVSEFSYTNSKEQKRVKKLINELEENVDLAQKAIETAFQENLEESGGK
ncbi:MAG: serine/threonine protein kinase [Lachnospiraceae bacterium]|nr:serine/threonine protein kinase [Lachnospiraceae bacterium]